MHYSYCHLSTFDDMIFFFSSSKNTTNVCKTKKKNFSQLLWFHSQSSVTLLQFYNYQFPSNFTFFFFLGGLFLAKYGTSIITHTSQAFKKESEKKILRFSIIFWRHYCKRRIIFSCNNKQAFSCIFLREKWILLL